MSNAFPQDEYFKIDPECHLIGDMGPINHFPGVQMWWRAIDNIRRPLTGCPPKMLDRAAQALGMACAVRPENYFAGQKSELLVSTLRRCGLARFLKPFSRS